ncbi:putative hydrolase protein [Xylariales sp. PMI_506]|nr:putative hydrolase protein [Xylariales sp. PMI_506]
MSSKDLHKPSAYGASKTALLLLDYQNVLVNMIQDPETKQKLIESVKALMAAARKNNVAIVHCLIDTQVDPPATNKTMETWESVHKPMLSAIPDAGAEYSEFAATAATTTTTTPGDGSNSGQGHESISLRAPGYRSVLVAKGILPLLREQLGVGHLVLGGIATSGAILGTASHATDLDFVVTIVEDACWDPSQAVHRTLIDTVLPVLAYVLTVEEAVAHWTE